MSVAWLYVSDGSYKERLINNLLNFFSEMPYTHSTRGAFTFQKGNINEAENELYKMIAKKKTKDNLLLGLGSRLAERF